MAQRTPKQEAAYTELDGSFAHLANVVAMVSWHLVSGVRRVQLPDGSDGWFISRVEGSQALSMLRMAEEFGERVMADIDGGT